ncbi:potassium transporter 5-like [Magnolia sinica]|uniref:potassium transporter 5-like n=1 Tax=Magnolia sinica TaxID=86752 RepID=UPI0026595059|nr:potassium transporter 5-like [Magnolia sinica]
MEIPSTGLKERKLSREKLRRYDSWDVEAATYSGGHGSKNVAWATILHLAFQSIGVVYGDIGTSPLYVFPSAFTNGIQHNDDILGVLSLIFYTLTLLPLIKYVFFVLHANDNGDGGTFALYSLICRYVKVSLIPSQQAEDREVSNFHLELPSNRLRRASKLKSTLEKSPFAKYLLLFVTMLGTSMVIGDGILAPCISVLSAVGGIKEATSAMTQGRIVWVSVGILICLFLVQRFGTDKVGYSFAPIIIVWFLMISGIGIYNFAKYDPSVVKALNPKYIIDYFRRNKKDAWVSLGGAVLAITGTEAMFADLGHFTVRSIQISMCSVTFPSVVLAYMGQASYLRQHNSDVGEAFYRSIPDHLYWPMFVVAVLASIIASQAMISGTFSIIQQSLSLGCFPLVKIVHTSSKYEGQVYIPEINYLLMVACVAVTAGFKTTEKIGNAYGIAVVFVMTLTSALLVLIMVMIWKTHIIFVILYILIIGSVELLYLSSVLYKFDQGGYLPLAFAAFLVFVMCVWNYVYRKKYSYELQNKVSPDKIREIATDPSFRRLPGIALFYSELVQGIPPIFKQYIANVPALHSVLVFVSVKSLPISKVLPDERFLFRRVGQGELAVFRCVVRYGYKDTQNENESFEVALVDRLKEFIRDEMRAPPMAVAHHGGENGGVTPMVVGQHDEENGSATPMVGDDGIMEGGDAEEEKKRLVEFVEREMNKGVVHLLGESEVVARKGSGIGRRVLIDYAYNALRRNLRQRDEVFEIPHKRLLKVGMTYEL